MLSFIKYILESIYKGFLGVYRGVWAHNEVEGIEFAEEPEAAMTLVKLVVYYRHGHRPPLIDPKIYNFVYSKFLNERGTIMTKHGKVQCYLLGQRLRKRYNNILTPSFSKTNLVALSTSVDRTMMSSSLVLAGMYPPTNHDIWNKDLLWSPIPVYQDDSPNKYFNSRRYLYEFLKHESLELNKKMRGLLPVMEKNCGRSAKHPTYPYMELILLWDLLTVLNYHDEDLPDWGKQFVEENEAAFCECFKQVTTHSEVQKQLSSSVLGDNILSFLQNSKRVMLHCMHDLNMFMLSGALGFDIQTWPHPTSCFAIEFHEKGGEQTVKAFYFPSPQDPAIPITMTCGVEPSLADFKEMLTSLRPKDYDTLQQTVPDDLEVMKNDDMWRPLYMAVAALQSNLSN